MQYFLICGQPPAARHLLPLNIYLCMHLVTKTTPGVFRSLCKDAGMEEEAEIL